MTTDEIISMAGVDAMTLPAEVLEELSSTTDSQESLEARSVFQNAAQTLPPHSPRLSYINDKAKFHRAFTINGRGKAKTEDVSKIFVTFLLSLTLRQAIAVFCGFQTQAEAFVTSFEEGLSQTAINGSVIESPVINGSVIEPQLLVATGSS